MRRRRTGLAIAGGLLLFAGMPVRAVVASEADGCVAAPARPEPAPRGAPASPPRAAARAAREDLEAGRRDGLEERLDAARALARREQYPDERARLRLHLGRTSAALAEGERGGPALAAAGRDFSAAAEAASDPRLRSYALGYLGELHERAGRPEEAMGLARRALFEAQRADAPDAEYRWHWQIARLERAAGRRATATRAYRQAVATLERIRRDTGAEAHGARTGIFRTSVEPVYLGLVDLLLRAAHESAADAQQALLAEARGTLEALKAAELRDYFRDPCLQAQHDAALDDVPGAVVVYPIALPDRLELVVGRAGRLRSYRVPVSAEALDAEVRRFRRLLEKRTTREYLRPARNLHDWLIRPLEPVLGDDVDALVFVPGGALRTIPPAALQDRETRRFLVERFPVAITPGLTLTEPRAIDKDHVRLLAVGLTGSVDGYPALRHVRRELDRVSRAFPATVLVDEEFRVERLERQLEGRPFGIVHIASHGEFSADASESFLLAYDGRVSMSRLAEAVGATRFRERQPLELLALSACQTAAGDERAALGLAGMAVRSGARSALATLWPVNDQASTDLVSEFYAQLGESGVSRAEALRRAQVKLLHTPHYRHAAYWSPFLLISSWL